MYCLIFNNLTFFIDELFSKSKMIIGIPNGRRMSFAHVMKTRHWFTNTPPITITITAGNLSTNCPNPGSHPPTIQIKKQSLSAIYIDEPSACLKFISGILSSRRRNTIR